MDFSDHVTNLLLASVTSDVGEFLGYWLRASQADPTNYPLIMSEDKWVEEFYNWMKGRI